MSKKESKELTPDQCKRKAEKEAQEAKKRKLRLERKKERKALTKKVSHVLEDAFMIQAVSGVKIHDGDAIRTYRLNNDFNGTSTAMLASIAKAARQIAFLGKQAEAHIENRHLDAIFWRKSNRWLEEKIDKRVRKGKLVKTVPHAPECAPATRVFEQPKAEPKIQEFIEDCVGPFDCQKE